MNTDLFRINPKNNPAILDTLTWNKEKLSSEISKDKNEIRKVLDGKLPYKPDAGDKRILILDSKSRDKQVGLYRSSNGQAAFFLAGKNTTQLGAPFLSITADTDNVDFFKCNYSTTGELLKELEDDVHSIALGYSSRLGIGSRMTTFSWKPAIDLIKKYNISTNLIQNSVREVRVYDEMKQGKDARDVYLYSFGTIKEGHAGSTFEGLWLSGTVEALLSETNLAYGSDADHIKLDDLGESLSRAKSIIRSCRNYSFFTIDTSGLVKFNVEQTAQNDILNVYEYHKEIIRRNHIKAEADRDFIETMLCKYEDSLKAMKELDEYLHELKGVGNYDLEWSIDEIPAGHDVETNITTTGELLFLLTEVKRREIKLTHIAPNFGVEKGTDYRMKYGREYLFDLLRSFKIISDEFGIMLDVHSGDNLSSETKRIINKATNGEIHYKISPITQEIFAETLYNTNYEDFLFWWKEAYNYAKKKAEEGSDFAAKCLKVYERSGGKPSPDESVFHYFHYPPIGEISADGNLTLREYLYSLDKEIYQAYDRRFNEYLVSITDELFSTNG
ncbi:MAG: tagaturonate epimerase family protein [Spirochaetales bacterium]|uniref:Tagaturonate epimerase family protein n=1 Tax=Candidatus Thalassospirochaeta sargassi TaxID=3119039 RepID=A0AAJ1IF82_9SPIO|nr:tagaturonate epimerase family protein [Spirochaetales bacterium]